MYKFALILVFALSACSTTNHSQIKYLGPLEIYPAVIYVFNEMHARAKELNLKSNTFISERIYNKKLNIKYNIKVIYKNKIIESSLINVKQPHAHHKSTWVPYNGFFPLNDSDIRKAIDTEILAILDDTKKYKKIKNDILNEVGFHYVVASKMRKPDASTWINDHMAGRKFILHLINYDPEFRVNDTQTAIDKKYIAHFRYKSQKWVNSDFDLDLYTNNAYYEHMPLNTHITTLADFIQARVQIYIVTFGFSFDQLVPEI